MRQFLKSRWRILIISLAVIGLLIFFQSIHLFKATENIITTVLKPVQTLFSETSRKIKGIFVFFKDIKKLEEKNIKLKDKIANLTVENSKLKKDIEDSQIIREELDYITKHQYQSVTAKIIGISSDEYSQVLIINKGETTGIGRGYPVIVNNGILVGKIIDTNSQISKMILLNNNHSEVSAVIQNEDRGRGIVTGQFGISLKMELIPQDQNIRKNQLVITSGIEKYIPADIIIGKIDEIMKREGELFQEAIIEPAVNYQNLSIVTVILQTHE